MSFLWAEALHRAYPPQQGRFRPSGLGGCGRRQVLAASTSDEGGGVPPSNPDWSGIWQQELGRAGQDIATLAFPHLGFNIQSSVKIEGSKLEGGGVDGEADWVVTPRRGGNVLGWDDTPILCDVKIRNAYAYCFVWDGNSDLMTFDKGVGVQVNYYAGVLGLERIAILLLPFDGSAVRNNIRFSGKRMPNPNIDPGIRILTTDYNHSIYTRTVERLEFMKEHGLEVAPEFDPTGKDAKFPCGYCGWQDWCIKRGPNGLEMPDLPDTGLPLREHAIG